MFSNTPRRVALVMLVRRFTVVMALLGWSHPVSGAVDNFLGRIVGSVHLTIEGRETSDPALAGAVRTPVGQPLSMAAVRETIADLFSFRRFEDVQVDATLEGDRVALRYDLTPIHPVTKLQFTGGMSAPGLDQGDLRRAVLDRFGVSPQYGRASEIAAIVASTLAERGYLHAAVTPHVDVEHAPERAILTLSIEPGVRTTIGDVELVGQPSIPRQQFLAQLGLTPGTPYERDALDARIERYVAERRRRGYYEARVVPAIELAEGDGVANLTIVVSPGPHVRVVFSGDPLPPDRRVDLVPIEREGSVDEDLLEDSSNRIEDYLRSEGYRNASAPHARQENGDELLITFNIKRGQQARVSTLKISGNQTIPLSELPANLRLRVGEPFSEARMAIDVAAIEDAYRRRGFISAKARASSEVVTATPPPAQIPVAVSIAVAEGVRTLVDDVRFTGNESVPEEALRAKIRLQAGAPFVPAQMAVDLDAIRRLYEDRGYDTAGVEARPTFTESNTRVTVTFGVREGPQIFVDHVLIVGNARTSTETIERELQVKSGDPFSRSAILEGQRRLTALGLFRRVLINEVPHGGETTRDLLVTVEEAPPTSIGYGGGLEGRVRVVAGNGGVATDRFEVAPRASFEIGRRNLFGKNRSVNLFTSISLHPKDSPIFAGQTASSTTGAYGFGLTEYRVVGTYREPRVFDTIADAFVNGTLEQQIRSSFNFARRSASAVVARRLTRTLAISGTYQIQRTRVFDVNVSPSDQLLIDRTFPQFLLSSFSASLIRDTRDDKVDAAAGEYMSANTQLAGQRIGSEVGFSSSRFAAQIFRTIPHTSRIVIAGQAQLGLAAGFTTVTINGQTAADQLPASERFFAGGDTTVRGFALDELGVRHFPPQPNDTIDKNGFPLGGNGLVVFNAELRAPVWRGLGAVGFVDTGNVFARATDISLTELRSAIGGGLRYKSPVGPIRVDLGFKVNRQPGEGLTAFFVSFGQAF